METFRQEVFNPSVPCMLPRAFFSNFPAISKWFHNHILNGNDRDKTITTSTLNTEYLDQYGDVMLPLEITHLASAPRTISENFVNEYEFMRSRAPLSLFLEWTKQALASTSNSGQSRLYLAQAALADLPKALVEDLPVPEIVTKAGKGDVYDANLWIGVSPTYTPLHRDPNPNLFVQIAGRKAVRIMESQTGGRVFDDVQRALGRDGSALFRGEEMMKGKERMMLENFIWDDEVELDESMSGGSGGYEAIVGVGDGIFIPKGWWHSVRGIGEGITGSVGLPSKGL